MDDLKSMTVRYLRDLARKHLGRGHTRLKTKAELLAALAEHVPALARLTGRQGAPAASSPEAPAAKPSARKGAPAARPPEAPAPKASVRKPPTPAPGETARTRPVPKDAARPEPRARGADGGARREASASAAADTRRPAGGGGPPTQGPARRRGGGKEAAEGGRQEAGSTPARPPRSKARPAEAARPAEPPPQAAEGLPASASPAPGASPAPTRTPATVVHFHPRERAPHRATPEPTYTPPRTSEANEPDRAPGGWRPAQASAAALAPAADLPESQHASEPVIEGFFVARIAGVEEVRRHHLTDQGGLPAEPTAHPGVDERLGELAPAPVKDTLVALPRDPHTLFVFWDLRPETVERVGSGLHAPRPRLRVYDGEALVRDLDFDLGSRSYYVHGLPPGRTYRVEAHLVGADGRSRRLGPASARALPPAAPSGDKTVRFMHMPPPAPSVVAVPGVPGSVTRQGWAQEREYVTWRRVQLPGSAEFVDVSERVRERVEGDLPAAPLDLPQRAPGSSESVLPAYLTLPPRAPGASESVLPAYLELPARAPGASEGVLPRHLELPPRAAGASESVLPPHLELPARAPGASESVLPAHLELPERAPGASERALPPHLELPARASGASEQASWTSPRSGQGR